MNYYENHKKDINNMKIRNLNVKYHINGYHIYQKKGKLILYPETTNKGDDIMSTKIDTIESSLH